jgi:fatty acid desaturase
VTASGGWSGPSPEVQARMRAHHERQIAEMAKRSRLRLPVLAATLVGLLAAHLAVFGPVVAVGTVLAVLIGIALAREVIS